MTPPKRTRIGRFTGLATRYSVYRTDSAIEIDAMDGFETQRRRVFFEDVLLITHHRMIGGWYILLMLFAIAVFGGISLAVAVTGEKDVANAFALVATPFAILLVLRLIVRLDVVTIFGRRTKAVLPYSFRKRFARETFDDLTERTRAAQQRLAEEIAAATPQVPALEMPDMPPMDVTEVAPEGTEAS